MRTPSIPTRRSFLQQCLVLGASSALAARSAGAQAQQSTTAPDPFSGLPRLEATRPVWVAWLHRQQKDQAYTLFRQAVERATDLSWLKPGDRVLVKLALNSGRPHPATSDPWCLALLLKLLRERGAGSVLVGDQSGVEHVLHRPEGARGASRDLCRSSGLLDVIEQGGAQPVFFEEAGYDAYIPEVAPDAGVPSRWPSPAWITRTVQDVDHIIYLPRISAHAVGDATLGYKLAVGFLRQDSRRTFHQRSGLPRPLPGVKRAPGHRLAP